MPSETKVRNSYIQETQEVDEGWEIIQHEESATAKTSKLEVQVGDGCEYSSTQPWEDNQPLSDTCTFSTPALPRTKGGIKAKSRLSGLPSALTPILKSLNIGNRCQSPDSIKPENTNGQPHSDSSSSHFGQILSDMNASVSLLEDERLPEVTLLDVTCDSRMQVTSVPATPATTQPVRPSSTTLQPSRLNASSRCNTTQMHSIIMDDPPEGTFPPLRWLDDEFFPEITLLDVTKDSESSPGVERFSVNVTQDISPGDAPKVSTVSSELSGQPVTDPDTTDNIKTGELSTTLNDKAKHLSPVSEQSDCVGPNMTKASLELTQDISVSSLSQNSQSSLEPGGSNMGDIHKIAEDTLITRVVNVTQDMNSFSDTSAQSAATQSCTLDMQSDTKTSDSLTEPTVASKTEESHTNQDSECSSLSPEPACSLNNTFTVVQPTKPSPSSNISSPSQTPHNGTLDLPGSNLNTPKAESEARDLAVSLSENTTENSLQMNSSPVKAGGLLGLQNTTFDRNSLHKSSGNSTLGGAAAATFCLQNQTFDTRPPRQNGTITLSETSEGDSQHNTVDLSSSSKVCDATSSPHHTSPELKPPKVKPPEVKPPEVKPSDVKPSEVKPPEVKPPEVKPSDVKPSDVKPPELKPSEVKPSEAKPSEVKPSEAKPSELKPSEVKPSEAKPSEVKPSEAKPSELKPSEVSNHNSLASVTDPGAKKADTPESTLEADQTAEKASETGQITTKDSSGSPMDKEVEGLTDTSVIQHRDLQSSKAGSFNLDDTLDLAADSLITSTPMVNCKMFSFNPERDAGKTFGATKKLYGDVPSKAGGQMTSEIPSNIICDRKTFLTKPTAKSFIPSSKSAALLLKYKPASTFPSKFEAPASGLPMTRQRVHAEALRSTAACDAPKVPAGTSSSYNLRTTTTGSKQPSTGLRKPQSSGLPSNIQRAPVGVRPLSARSNAPAPSSSTDKLRAPTANPPTKTLRAKTHPLSRADALQVIPRKRKIDAALPSSNAEASTFSGDAANRAKKLKPHTACPRALPALKEDSAAHENTSETSTSCDAVSRARVLKQPAANHRALIAKPRGCANCVALEQQLKLKSEEIKRLKEELENFCKEDDFV